MNRIRETGLDQALQQLHLVVGGQDDLFVLQPVAQADFT